MTAQCFSHARVRQAERVLSQTLAGEAVLLDLNSEQYFGLNSLGTRVWELIGQLGEVEPILETLIVEYDADPDIIANDLRSLLAQLVRQGLVHVDGDQLA